MDAQDKKRLQVEKARYAKATREFKKNIENEPKLNCTFVNLEFKGADLMFVYGGTRYHLEDGKDCKLPLSVIEHLNSLKIPVKRYRTDPETGFVKPQTEVHQMLQRFSVTPKNFREYTKVLEDANGEDK
jgi:hypothetical protein